jgi:hypothetical protein
MTEFILVATVIINIALGYELHKSDIMMKMLLKQIDLLIKDIKEAKDKITGPTNN